MISFQRPGSTPLERSGSGVWIRGLDHLWDRGLIQTLHFEPQPYACIHGLSYGRKKIVLHALECQVHKSHLNPTNVEGRHESQAIMVADHLVLHAFAPFIQKLGI